MLDIERTVVMQAFADAERNGIAPAAVQVGSIDILEALRLRHPGASFTWIMGARLASRAVLSQPLHC